jgi:DNA-binding winged helix-turn-helix (wHTH) protein
MSTQIGAVAGQGLPTGDTKWPARYAKFGQFQMDLDKEELYEGGRRCKIQAKVYQALVVLLSRAGEIVTREEVCKRLWPDSVQVNFDANVNTTINKLRLVLSDSPDKPAYVETIPRRGYSFLAPVEFSNEPLMAKPERVVGRAAEQEGGEGKRRGSSLFRLQLQRTPLRMAGFVLVGILVGAILVLAWSAVANKTQRSQNLGRQNAQSVPVSSAQTALAPAQNPNHKM